MPGGRKNGHVTAPSRFWPRVDVGLCWEWTGAVDKDGYGKFTVQYKDVRAHRWAWEHLVGPIPTGFQMDHLCRNTRCVNPDHLEPVTAQENMRRSRAWAVTRERHRRKTHCKRGHEYAEVGVYLTTQGNRDCWACIRARRRKKVTSG